MKTLTFLNYVFAKNSTGTIRWGKRARQQGKGLMQAPSVSPMIIYLPGWKKTMWRKVCHSCLKKKKKNDSRAYGEASLKPQDFDVQLTNHHTTTAPRHTHRRPVSLIFFKAVLVSTLIKEISRQIFFYLPLIFSFLFQKNDNCLILGIRSDSPWSCALLKQLTKRFPSICQNVK